MTTARINSRVLGTAVRTTLLFTLVLGIGYPAVVTLLGRVAFPDAVAGSVLTDSNGTPRGSALLGQPFTDGAGRALVQYFQSRPSAVDHDATGSGGSNLGPENPDLIDLITQRRNAVAELEGVAPELVPADAITASASGLDPHISPEWADLQIPRVAAARGLSEEALREVVSRHTTGRLLGVLGEPTVNVVELNHALDGQGR